MAQKMAAVTKVKCAKPGQVAAREGETAAREGEPPQTYLLIASRFANSVRPDITLSSIAHHA